MQTKENIMDFLGIDQPSDKRVQIIDPPEPSRAMAESTSHSQTLAVIRQCYAEDCTCSHLCPYPKNGQCAFEVAYMDRVSAPFLALLDAEDAPFLEQAFSVLLTPLFLSLVSLEKLRLGIPEADMIYRTSSGAITVHPIYREMRNIIKDIGVVMKSSGLMDAGRHHGLYGTANFSSGISNSVADGLFKEGESSPGHANYYEAVQASVEKERQELNKQKKEKEDGS